MKTSTRDDYLRRIDRAVALLQLAVDADDELPALPKLAEVAHLSPFHFHRIYRALTGETVGATVSRLRLLRALHLLQQPAQRITEAALAIGYETPQAFARAFRRAFDSTPSELRGQGERLQQEIQRLRQPPRSATSEDLALQVEVVSVAPFRLVATRYVGDRAAQNGTYAWLFAWAAERGLLERLDGIYGVRRDDPPDMAAAFGEYECALAMRGDELPSGDGVSLMQLGGGLWARARHVGAYEALDAFTDRFIGGWWADSGYALREELPYRHFHDDPEQVPEPLLRADVYLPIAPQAAPSAQGS